MCWRMFVGRVPVYVCVGARLCACLIVGIVCVCVSMSRVCGCAGLLACLGSGG